MKSSSRPVTTALAALPWILVVALTALNLLYMSRLGPNDDAYITFRVARNLAAGHGPVFNPGEQVLSVTTPGYMLLLAAASVVSRDFVRLGLALNGVALLLVGALVIDLSHIVNPTGPETSQTRLLSALSATVAVSLTLTFPLLTAAIGMETPLFMAAILATFAAYRRALQPDNDDRSTTVLAAVDGRRRRASLPAATGRPAGCSCGWTTLADDTATGVVAAGGAVR